MEGRVVEEEVWREERYGWESGRGGGVAGGWQRRGMDGRRMTEEKRCGGRLKFGVLVENVKEIHECVNCDINASVHHILLLSNVYCTQQHKFNSNWMKKQNKQPLPVQYLSPVPVSSNTHNVSGIPS